MPHMSYLEKMSGSMLQLKEEGFLCDTVLIVDTEEIRTHSLVLAAGSSLFKEILRQHERTDGLFYLNFLGYDVESLKIALSYLYTGRLVVPAEFIQSEKLTRLSGLLEQLGLPVREIRLLVDNYNRSSENQTKAKRINQQLLNGQNCDSELQNIDTDELASDHDRNILCLSSVITSQELHLAKHQSVDHSDEKFETNTDKDTSNGEKIHQVSDPSEITNTSAGRQLSCLQNTDRNTCELCGKVYPTRIGYYLHINSHNGIKVVSCHTCSRHFKSEGSLRRHLNAVHNDPKSFVCQKCGRTFKSKAYLRIHSERHRKDVSHLCYICGKGFRGTYKLSVHLQACRRKPAEKMAAELPAKQDAWVIDGNRFRCLICGKSYGSKRCAIRHINEHIAKDTDDQLCSASEFTCEICGRMFNTEAALISHKKHHKVTNLLPSMSCCKLIQSKILIEQLALEHSDEHPVVCSVCHEPFQAERQLQEHEAMLHNNQEFSCKKCNRKRNLPRQIS